MNIIKHELKIYMKSTITWIISLVFIVSFFALVYPTFSSNAATIEGILENFPQAFKDAIGLSELKMTEVIGFYGFVLTYITLTGAIQAMNLGLSLLSNELIDKTADFLLAKPVKRIKIVHSKFIAALSYIILTNVIYLIASKIAFDMVSENSYSFKLLLLYNGSLFLIQLFFLTFGMLISVFMNKMKTVVPISLGIVFGFFVINLLNESLTDKPLTAFTPFGYFSASGIYDTGGYNMGWLTLNLGLVVLFTVGAYIRYIKRDIPTV